MQSNGFDLELTPLPHYRYKADNEEAMRRSCFNLAENAVENSVDVFGMVVEVE